MKHASRAAIIAALTLALAPSSALAEDHPERAYGGEPTSPVQIQLLGINDFHGALEPSTVAKRLAGGAGFLDAHLNRAAALNPRGTIRVHAGDMVGASPLISSWFHDEPAIKALNTMQFDVGTVGNHEFDEGGEEMLRLIHGGHREDGKQFKTAPGSDTPQDTSDPNFEGANFPYIAANTRYRASGEYVLPPVKVIKRQGEKIGFIGVTTEDTPNIVLKPMIDPFVVDDISDTVNKWAARLQKRGVESIVVLAHSGGFRTSNPAIATGEIIDEASEMSDAVDVIVAGHTHSLLNNVVDGKLIVSAFANGTAFDDVDLKIDPRTHDVASKIANVPTTWDDEVTPTSDAQAVVDEYRQKIAPIADTPVGQAATTLTRTTAPNQADSPLGNVIADAQRAYAGTDLAVMNPGGIRDDIQAGEVTYGELFKVQPFDNQLFKFTITGAELKTLIQQGLDANKIMQVSGFTYSANKAAKTFSDLKLADGSAVQDDKEYTMAANEFVVGGGDGAAVLKTAAADKTRVSSDLDALVAAFQGKTVDAPTTGRIAITG